MIPRERTPYSAIVDRPPLKLPGGARLVRSKERDPVNHSKTRRGSNTEQPNVTVSAEPGREYDRSVGGAGSPDTCPQCPAVPNCIGQVTCTNAGDAQCSACAAGEIWYRQTARYITSV